MRLDYENGQYRVCRLNLGDKSDEDKSVQSMSNPLRSLTSLRVFEMRLQELQKLCFSDVACYHVMLQRHYSLLRRGLFRAALTVA